MVSGKFYVRQKPRVFYSYSYKNYEFLRPIFEEAASESDIISIFADEYIDTGDDIASRLKQLMISSDLIIFDLSEYNYNVTQELLFVTMMSKPFFIVSKRNPNINYNFHMDLIKYNVGFYDDGSQLKKLLIQYFKNFIKIFKRKENQRRIVKEDNLIDTINKSTEKNVMILGKDSDAPGQTKMAKIKSVVVKKGYFPVIMRDLPDIPEISLEGKMLRIAGLCRFLLVEDSRASGHIDELAICKMGEFVTGTLKQVGRGATWMQAHYPFEFRFIDRFCYEIGCGSKPDPLCDKKYKTIEKATEAAIVWAEDVLKTRKKHFSKTIYSL